MVRVAENKRDETRCPRMRMRDRDSGIPARACSWANVHDLGRAGSIDNRPIGILDENRAASHVRARSEGRYAGAETRACVVVMEMLRGRA